MVQRTTAEHTYNTYIVSDTLHCPTWVSNRRMRHKNSDRSVFDFDLQHKLQVESQWVRHLRPDFYLCMLKILLMTVSDTPQPKHYSNVARHHGIKNILHSVGCLYTRLLVQLHTCTMCCPTTLRAPHSWSHLAAVTYTVAHNIPLDKHTSTGEYVCGQLHATTSPVNILHFTCHLCKYNIMLTVNSM